MIQLTINLLTPQDANGWLTVRDAEQNVLGPCPVLRPLNAPISTPEGEQHIAGDESAAVCVVKEIIPMAGASLADIREFGRYGFVVLELAEDEPNSDRQVTLHGGDLDTAGHLRPATNSLRVSNSDMRELVQLITRYGKHNVSVLCTNVPIETTPSIAAAGSDDGSEVNPGQRPHFNFRVLPGWTAAAVPFIAASASYADCTAYDSGTSFSAVDFGYLLLDEGGYLLSGYVPDNSSGVTIAGGLDLGLETSADLLAMGFSQTQVTAWAPYLATSASDPLIGANARAALAAHPLSITQTAAAQINVTYYTWISNTVGAAYTAAVKTAGKLPGVTFSSLPAAWQTAIADMYLVYPSFTTTTCFTQLASGEWTEAIASLQDFNGPKVSINERAKANGDYLSTKLSGLPT